jgi:Ca2+-binding EF-hand superfamily protein
MEAALMNKRLLLCGALVLGVGLFPGTTRAQTHKTGDLPGPIDSISDLQDTAKMLFKLADTNNDGRISQKEAVDVGNLLVGGFFFRADANGDGVLEPQEARAARESLLQQQPLLRYVLQKAQPTNANAVGQPVTGAVPATANGNPFAAIGRMLDSNNDQKIEAPELRQAVQSGVQVLFSVADTNQDGLLTPPELNQAVNEAARSMMQTAFQRADADHNGALSMDEFDKALTGPAHAVFRVLDGNNDNQLTLQELERAQQIIASQIQRLRVPEAPNSLRNQIQSNTAPQIGQPGSIPVTPAPVAPAPAVAPVRP